jgi:voltage-gated potassium channel
MKKKPQSFRSKLEVIIFGVDTPAGRAFDQFLIVAILLSVLVVILESVTDVHDKYGNILWGLEWFFTILFSIEYILRLWVAKSPLRYARSPLGIIDLLAILPTYLSLVLVGSQYLMTIRILRVLRIFRVFKLTHYLRQANHLISALRKSAEKIFIFLFGIGHVVLILGSVMYVVEGPAAGFDSIPRSIYWAIVTITTVGYGDISPVTPLGQFIASIIMITGYSVIAVPTGIVTVELGRAARQARTCTSCRKIFLEPEANFCPHCGEAVI